MCNDCTPCGLQDGGRGDVWSQIPSTNHFSKAARLSGVKFWMRLQCLLNVCTDISSRGVAILLGPDEASDQLITKFHHSICCFSEMLPVDMRYSDRASIVTRADTPNCKGLKSLVSCFFLLIFFYLFFFNLFFFNLFFLLIRSFLLICFFLLKKTSM